MDADTRGENQNKPRDFWLPPKKNSSPRRHGGTEKNKELNMKVICRYSGYCPEAFDVEILSNRSNPEAAPVTILH